MATIDSLDIQIAGSAKKANDAIDSLITNLDRLAKSLNIDTSGLEKIGKSLNFGGISKVAKNIQSQTQNVAKTLAQMTEQYKDLGKGFEMKGSTQQIQKQIDSLTNKLANAKLAKDDFETSGKTNLGGYETAVKNVIKYANQIESLKNQLKSVNEVKIQPDFGNTEELIERMKTQIRQNMEGVRIENPIDLASLSEKDFSMFMRLKSEMEQTAQSAKNMGEQIKENVSNIGFQSYDSAEIQKFIDDYASASTKINDLALRTEQFEQSLKSLKIQPINTDNINVLQRELAKSEANFEKLRIKLANGIAMGRISTNVDDKGFRILKEQMALAEKQGEALREKIKQVQQTSAQTSSEVKSFGESVKSASKSINDLKSSSTKAIKPLNNLGNSFRSLLRTILPILGIRQLFNWGRQSVEYASDLTEVQNVVDTTFGDMAYKVEDFAKTSIEQFGMSELALKQYSSRFQAMGTAMGFPIGQMSDMSIELTKLTADMASFYNVEQKDVAKSLESIFTGQTRPLRTYGLDLTQATLQEWALKQGIDANIQSMSQAEKTMLRYQYVLANTGAAQGDFARTANTWANQVRILKQNFEQLASVIGGTPINAFKPVVKAVNVAMGSIIAFAKTISNALGKIFGWTYEEGGGGLTQDFEGAEDATEGMADSTGTAAKNIDKMKKGIRAFDELKVINAPDDNGGQDSGTGAGGLGELNGGALGGGWVQGDSIIKQFESELDNLYKLGDYIGNTLKKAMDSIEWNSVYEKARNFGKGLADFLNGLISPDLFGALGRTIAGALNTAMYSALSFGKTFDWKDFGLSIATGINNFFETYDFASLAQTLNVWAKGILDTAITAIDNTDWDMIGKKIGTFLSEIDLIEIGSKIGELFWKALNAGFELFAGTFKKAPIETILISLAAMPGLLKKIAASKFITGIGKLWKNFKIWGEKLQLVTGALTRNQAAASGLYMLYPKLSKKVDGVKTAFSNFFSSVKSNGFWKTIDGGITNIRNNLGGLQKAAIVGIAGFAEFSVVSKSVENLTNGTGNLLAEIGKIAGVVTAAGAAMYVALGPAGLAVSAITGITAAVVGFNKAAGEQEEIKIFGDTLSNISQKLNESAESLKQRAQESRNYVEGAGLAEMTMASDLADRYFDLAEKENITNAEKDEMQRLAGTLVDTLPGLEKYYDTEMGLLNTTRDSINDLIEARLREIQLSAVEDELKKAYSDRNEALEDLKLAMDTANSAQEHMNGLQDEYNRLNEAYDTWERYNELSNQLQTATGDTSALVEEQKNLWNELTNNGENVNMVNYDYLVQSIAEAEREIEGFQSKYKEAQKNLVTSTEAYDDIQENLEYYMGIFKSGMMNYAKEGIGGYTDTMQNNSSMAEETRKKVQETIDAMGSGTGQMKKSGVSLGKSAGDGLTEGLTSKIVEAAQAGAELGKAVLEELKDEMEVNSPSKATMRIGEYTANGFARGISLNEGGALSVVNGFASNIISTFSGIESPLNQIGINAGAGLLNGISSMEGSLLAKAGNIAANIAKTVRDSLDIHSPSRVMFELGGYTMQGFQDGLENLYQPILKSVKGFSSDLQVAPAPGLSDMYSDYQYSIPKYTAQYGFADYQQTGYGQNNSETNELLRELLSEIRKGHVIELDDGVVAGRTRKIANAYTRSQGEPYFAI